jgi:hypothetical protein
VKTAQTRVAATSTFSASVEVGRDAWCTIWIAELRGLFVNMSSERAAVQAVPAAITGHLQWLERHGELPHPPTRFTLSVTERHRARGGMRWGDYEVLHEFERPPVTPEEVGRALRWMGCMRLDTVRLIESLPRTALDWSRPGQERSIRENLYHLARGERWYLHRLNLKPLPTIGGARNPLRRLAHVRGHVGWRLLHLAPEECARVVQTDGRWWSARKMLGRFLYHERYHLRSIARIVRYHRAPVPAGLGGWPRY